MRGFRGLERAMTSLRASWGRLLALASVAMLVGCDHATKVAAKAELGHGAIEPIVGNLFQLRYAENRDVAFNLLDWMPEAVRGPLLLAVGVLAVVGLAVWLLSSRGWGVAQRVGVTLILAGALGNLIDRVLRGYVVDFMHLPHWPIFNLADVYVCAGAALLLLSRKPRPDPGPAA